MTLSYTPRLHLAIPDFLTEPWHSEFEQAMQSIDRAIYNSVLAQGAALWVNNHAYVIGDLIISPDNGAMYSCAVAHTSAVSGTFTDDSTAHPTFWTTFAPSLATQAEAEAGVENTKYMSALRTSQAISALTAATSLNNPRCGVLEFVSSTSLIFKPKLGDRIKINGVLQAIPAAGITILNTGLLDNTTYLVFAFMSAGVLTGELRNIAIGPITHAPSIAAGNVGTEIMVNAGTPDETRTLIGIVSTIGSHAFVNSVTQRFVRSWFNDPGALGMSNFTTSRSSASATYAEVNSEIRVSWVNFSGEIVGLGFIGNVFDDGTARTVEATFGLDVALTVQDVWAYVNLLGTGKSIPLPFTHQLSPTEGQHFATLLARVTTGGGTPTATFFNQANSAGNRTTLKFFIGPRG